VRFLGWIEEVADSELEVRKAEVTIVFVGDFGSGFLGVVVLR